MLSIDGGGLRGLFSASLLNGLTKLASDRFDSDISDFGDEFDLIVGTSTGAILGCGLAYGMPLREIISLYINVGEKIFPRPLPKSKLQALLQNRKKLNEQGDKALRSALQSAFGNKNLASIYHDRNIGLVIPTVNMTTHKAWVFKTPHDPSSSHRDDEYSLVDVCLASSAAPVYRSLAAVKNPGNSSTFDMFADGGLWANNPVLVALIEALRVANSEQNIEVFSVGTSAAPNGSTHSPETPHWGITEWGFGAKAIELSMDAQTSVAGEMADMLAAAIDRNIHIVRFPEPNIPREHAKLLGLDNSSQEAHDLLQQLASTAVDQTNQLINSNNSNGILISKLLGNKDAQH
uniref:Patatin n=1 Tax=uncultured Thiotrichaceae bacterium TaxID=298394 RepID=A0A6S6U3G2_9GAMM|nr:MAG: Patatin [uncultured Thiotrichaceae bacterium]